MKFRIPVLPFLAACGLAALVAATGVDAARPATLAGNHDHALSHGGRSRTYHLHVPRSVTRERPAPLLVALHGGGGSGPHMQRNYGLDAVADREGFLVVYPDGTGRLRRLGLTWNAGTCCGYAVQNRIDDVGFLRVMIADLARRYPVDTSRIYVTGHSNGGMMAHRFAREASDLVAAAAPVAGATLDRTSRPARPVPILHIHSVDDPAAHWDGTISRDDAGCGSPPEETVTWWAQTNGCLPVPRIDPAGTWSPQAGAPPHTATRQVFAGGRGGAEVVLLKLTGAGHDWPGKQRSLLGRMGPPTRVIDANEEIWRFVRRWRR